MIVLQDATYHPSGHRLLYFTACNGSYKPYTSTLLIKNGEGFATVEDALATLKHPVKDATAAARRVRIDFPVSGQNVIDYPEYKVVASSIASLVKYVVNDSGMVKFVKHPQFDLMVIPYL